MGQKPSARLHAVSVENVPRYGWGSGSDGWRLVDEPGLSVIQERVPCGGSEEWHVHDRARQFFFLLSGQLELRHGQQTVVLVAGTGVEVPPGVSHQFANTGDGEATFLVISAPSTRADRRRST